RFSRDWSSDVCSSDLPKLIILQLLNRFVQNLIVHFKTNLRDKSRLLGTQQIARTPNIQITHSDIKTRTELREFLDRRKTFVCFWSQGRHRRTQQVTKRFFIRTPYATAHLVQVTQSKHMCVVDYNRIGIWYIQSCLNNSRSNENIKFVVDKFQHHIFQVITFQLAMSYTYARPRY